MYVPVHTIVLHRACYPNFLFQSVSLVTSDFRSLGQSEKIGRLVSERSLNTSTPG